MHRSANQSIQNETSIQSFKIFRNKNKKYQKNPRKEALERWDRLRCFVHRGQYRAFSSDVSSSYSQKRNRATLRLPSEFLIEQDDTIEEKFTKIIAHQVHKIRNDETRPMHQRIKSLENRPLTKQDIEELRKDEEAYDISLKCLSYPILEHDLDDIRSRSNSSTLENAPRESEFHERRKSIGFNISIKTPTLSQNKSVGMKGSVSLIGGTSGLNESHHNGHRLADGGLEEIASGPVLKCLKEKVKTWLHENTEKNNANVDKIYFHVLLDFHMDILKKKMSQIVNAGASYSDLVSIFQTTCRTEILNRMKKNDDSDRFLDTEVLYPYTDLNSAVYHRSQRFIDVLNESIDETKAQDIIDIKRKNQTKSNVHRHQRTFSRLNGLLSSADKNQSDDRKIQAFNGPSHSHLRTSTVPSRRKSSIVGVLPFARKVSYSQRSDDENVRVETFLTNHIKDAFFVSDSAHLRHVARAQDPEELKMLINELEDRLSAIEQTTESSLGTWYSQIEFTMQNAAAYHYWKLLERRVLKQYLSKISKIYNSEISEADYSKEKIVGQVEPADPQPNETGNLEIRVRIIQARDIKRNNPEGELYASVQCGKNRFITETTSTWDSPRWDQFITLNVKPESRKSVKISVWKKSNCAEALINPLNKKFWKDELDENIGTAFFRVPSLVDRIKSSEGGYVKSWFPLVKKSKKSTTFGEIQLEFMFPNEMIHSNDQISAEIPESNNSDESNIKQRKLVYFKNYEELYKYIANKLVLKDMRQWHDIGESETLSRPSRAILEELGERWRINSFWRRLCLFESLIALMASDVTVPLPKIRKLYDMLEDDASKNHDAMSSIKLISPPQILLTNQKEKIIYPAIVSGEGEHVIDDKALEWYSILCQKLSIVLESHIQRYKDYFPFNSPKGALDGSLNLYKDVLYSNNYLFGKHPAIHDSGLSIEESDKNMSVEQVEKIFESKITGIVQAGTIERYLKLYEMAAPLENNITLQATKLADLISEEIDSDKTYFRQPYSAFINLPALTSTIYMKFFTLEMTFISSLMDPKSEKLLYDKPVLLAASHIFELYNRVRELQQNYLPLAVECEDSYSSETLTRGFSLHNWFEPCLHSWLIISEGKLLEWVDTALKMDHFQAINEENGLLHSTSVVDLFFCSRQMVEVLKKLEWEKAGGSPVFLDLGTELDNRRHQWASIMTRYSRVLSRSIIRYCEKISKMIDNERKSYIQRCEDDFEASFASRQCLSTFYWIPTRTRKLLTRKEWLANAERASRICVMVNNVESARSQLLDVYNNLNVQELSEWMNNTEDFAEQSGRRQSISKSGNNHLVSGLMNIKVVCAENLIACDTGGLSDPFCQVLVKEPPKGETIFENLTSTQTTFNISNHREYYRPIAKTKTIRNSLNPRWNEEFQAVLNGATEIEISVFDYDMFTSNDLCGKKIIKLYDIRNLLSSGDSHDLWLDLHPQGRVLIRLSLQPLNVLTGTGLVADIEYYFRKTFRELKRATQDMLTLVTDSMNEILESALVKILRGCDSRSKMLKIFQKKQNNFKNYQIEMQDVSSPINRIYVTDEEVEKALLPLTGILNEMLGILAQQLYPCLSEQLLRQTWQQLLVIAENLLLPQLFGDHPVIIPLKRTRPLSQRQVEMLIGCIEILKLFFHADGEEVGVPMNVLESKKYQDIQVICEMYWKDLDIVREQYLLLMETPKTANDETHDVDYLLRLLRIRINGLHDKKWKEFFAEELVKREKRHRSNIMV